MLQKFCGNDHLYAHVKKVKYNTKMIVVSYHIC